VSTALLILRLIALYHDVPWVKWLLWVVFGVGFGARLAIAIIGAYAFSGESMDH